MKRRLNDFPGRTSETEKVFVQGSHIFGHVTQHVANLFRVPIGLSDCFLRKMFLSSAGPEYLVENFSFPQMRWSYYRENYRN